MKRMIRALRHRNYRLFFIGQFISLIGTWITSIATGWLVYRLTQSEWMLGFVGFVSQFPSFLVGPFAGVLVDRWRHHRRVLLVTQTASMVQSFLLAALTLSGTINVLWICGLSIFQAFVNAFDMPARQAFVTEMVEDQADIPNAIALNSAMFNAARLIGPSIGGLIIAMWSEGGCFLIDGISYIAVVISLSYIRVNRKREERIPSTLFVELKEGWDYVKAFEPVRELLLLVALISLVATPHLVLMPVFAQEVFHGGPGLLGILTALSGMGAVTGALYLAARHSVVGMGSIISIAGLIQGVALSVFGLSDSLYLSFVALFFLGGAQIVLMASCNTIIQTIVEKRMRGRVLSFYMMAFIGMMPLGSLLAGICAHHYSAQTTAITGGVLALLVTLNFVRKLARIRSLIRPIYKELGIVR